MSNTKIEWATKVWNPVTGCTKVSDGCKYCYAERQWPRLAGNKKTLYHGRNFTDVECHEQLLQQPFKWKSPERIFVNSMSDLFHDAVPDNFIKKVLNVVDGNPRHTFIVLTKRPERTQEFFANFYDFRPGSDLTLRKNLWLGVSVEDQKTADERIPVLLETPAAKRIISYEPALGPVNFEKFLVPPSPKGAEGASSLDWIIAGGESGPKARPSHPQWFRDVRDQCAKANVPFFFKQWGEWAPQDDWNKGRDDYWKITKHGAVPRYRSHLLNEKDGAVDFVGKKKAGHLLDGKEYFQFPEGGAQ
ncbi:MAG: phage Gp37/Gp68 family protein [Candidatus Nitronauta litoralis]|uniref:Phage Gp37/Gp68 family protein n=1 Tax=Candidatus Nitronauta litoralis TaxID=2705533 RepID=A0A7T0G0B8_9BACT|nr:MAG: phage Gp37/Gp68 family protein [Candidatus Nitronauta litoralis]